MLRLNTHSMMAKEKKVLVERLFLIASQKRRIPAEWRQILARGGQDWLGRVSGSRIKKAQAEKKSFWVYATVTAKKIFFLKTLAYPVGWPDRGHGIKTMVVIEEAYFARG